MDRLLYLFILHEVKSQYCATFEMKIKIAIFHFSYHTPIFLLFGVDTENFFADILLFSM